MPKQKLPRTDHSSSTAYAADDSWEGDQIESDSKAEDENDSYNMSSKNRGVALIFNNENFENPKHVCIGRIGVKLGLILGRLNNNYFAYFLIYRSED